MAATARGIILTGDLGQLVIEASDREVAQFTKGQLVAIRSLAAPVRANAFMYGPSTSGYYSSGTSAALATMSDYQSSYPPSLVKATLKTRCGCQREIIVGYPPQPAIRIAIHNGFAALFEPALNDQLVTMREFLFTTIEHDHLTHEARAVYEEQP